MKRVVSIAALAVVLLASAAVYWFRAAPAASRTPDVPALLDRLARANSEQTRDDAMQALIAAGQPAVEPLLARYPAEAPESQIRQNAAFIFARMPGPVALKALQALLKLESDPTRQSAIRGQIDFVERELARPPPPG